MQLYDLKYRSKADGIYIQLYGKDEGEKKVVHKKPPFRPYCYMRLEDLNPRQIKRNGLDGSIDDAPDGFVKLMADHPRQISEFRKKCPYELFEADVPFTRRVLIDMDAGVDIPDTEDVLYYDIECVHEDTPITMADGPSKHASDIEPGDRLVAYDNGLQETTVRHVQQTEKNQSITIRTKLATTGWGRQNTEGAELQLGEEHPVLTRRGWIEAKNISTSDEIAYVPAANRHSAVMKGHKDFYDKSGEANPMYGHKWTDESLEKMSESLKGQEPWNKGMDYHQSRPDIVEAISVATTEAMQSIDMSGSNNSMYGRELSDETKAKIGKSVSETLDRPGGAFGPGGPSDETRRRMSESAKERIKRDGVYTPNQFYSEGLGHHVRSGWEEAVGLVLDEYTYEPRYDIVVDGDERSYFPDFETEDAVIEVSGFMMDSKRQKLEAFMDAVDKTFILVGCNGPCDLHIPFEERQMLADGGDMLWLSVDCVEETGGGVFYDFTCDPVSNFLANGAVVHNCDPRGEFPDPEDAEAQVLSIAAVGGDGREEFFIDDDENQLLEDFFEFADEYYLIVGWNSMRFDRQYLENRSENIGVDVDWRQYVPLDLYPLYKSLTWTTSKSFRLDDVAQNELGMEKRFDIENEFGMEILWDWFQERDPRLREYNMQDARILKELNDKLQLIQEIYQICRLCHTLPRTICYLDRSDQPRFAGGQACDGKILEKANKREYPLPCRGKFGDTHDFPGGHVFHPDAGMYDSVVMLDFSGMYPNIIRGFNFGPNTWYRDEEHLREHHPDATTDDIIIGESGVFLHPDVERSVLAEAVDEIIEMRYDFKSKKKAAETGTDEYEKWRILDAGMKAIVNTLYGVFASPYHRYYQPGMSENITLIGQAMLKQTRELVESGQFDNVKNVIYGDSVSGDTTLPIRHNGTVQLYRFDELLDIFEFKQLDATKDRYVPITNLETPAYDTDTAETEWKPVKQLVRHAADKPVYDCSTPRQMFSVTDDHSVISTNGNPVTVDEWEDGEEARRMLTQPAQAKLTYDLPESKQHLDVLEYVEQRIDGYGNDTDVDISSDRITVDHVYASTGHNKQQLRVGQVYDTRSIPRQIPLTEEFGYLLGFYIAEGSWGRVANSDQEKLKRFTAYYESVFDERPDYRSTRLNFSNTLISELFQQLCGDGAANKQFPDWYLEAPEEFILAMLQGWSMGDGSDYRRHDDLEMFKHSGSVNSLSRKLVSQAYFLVSNVFGLHPQHIRIKFRSSKGHVAVTWGDDRTIYRDRYHHRGVMHKKKRDVDYVYDISVEDNHTFIDSLGNSVLHNTDGIFLEVGADADELVERAEISDADIEGAVSEWPEASDDEIIEYLALVDLAEDVAAEVNDALKHWATTERNAVGEYLELDLDDIYRRFFIGEKKKRYFGHVIFSDGPTDDIKIKGFEQRRSNWPECAREFQKSLMLAKLDDDPTTTIIEEARHRLYTGQWDLQMTSRTSLTKQISSYDTPLPHTRAAEKIREDFGKEEVRVGDKIPWIKYGNNKTDVTHSYNDKVAEEFRPNEGYCQECDAVHSYEHEHEQEEYPHFRRKHYGYFFRKYFESSMERINVFEHDQQALEDFV